MFKGLHLAVLASTIMSGAHAAPLVIYGQDDRHEVYEASSKHQLLARSTAILISKDEMTRDASAPGLVQLTQTTLRDWIEASNEEEAKSKKFSAEVVKASANKITFCDGTRFTEQPNPGMCSGFLIAPDLMVTAGHCVTIDKFCEDYRWVFDFKMDKATQKAGVDIKEENIYKCEKVVSNTLFSAIGLDYAVVKLDRKVVGRAPLKINADALDVASKVMVIGGPSGLPTKVTTNGLVRKNNHPNFFVTNLDTFQGNSGSAVFDQETGVVQGILVRGEEDYVPDFERMCIKANECAEGDCRGEDVSRMNSIPEVALQKVFNDSAVSGSLLNLNMILDRKIYIDFNTADGQTALMKASAVAQNSSMKLLINRGASVKHTDVLGNTSLHALAAVLSEKNAEALVTLTDAGSELEAKNELGQSALLVAGASQNLVSAKILIKAGADKNAVDAKGENLLFSFVRAGNDKAVVELASMGVDTHPILPIASSKLKLKLKLAKITRNLK